MIMALLACSLIAAPGAAMAESWTRLRKVSPAASRRWAMNVYSGTHFDTGSSQEASLSATSEAMSIGNSNALLSIGNSNALFKDRPWVRA
jgi:hypothetical protein